MRHRFTKVLLGAALFMLLGGTATVAARSHSSSQPRSYNVGFIYPRTGLLGAYGAEEIQGFKDGLKYADQGHEQGQRQDAQHHLRRRQG